MGVMMKLKGLKQLEQGKWEYRKRVPASAQKALGKTERKEVIEAHSDKDLMRKYAVVVANIDAEIAAAKAPRAKATPRVEWEAALVEAEKLASGVFGVEDPDEARQLVVETLLAEQIEEQVEVEHNRNERFDQQDALDTISEPPAIGGNRKQMLVQALLNPHRTPPAYTLQDAYEIYVKEKLEGGSGRDHRAALVRHERVLRLAEKAGLPLLTPLSEITREHARKVRDHMSSRAKQGGDGEKVSPSSVKKELGMLRRVIDFGALELGIRDYDNPFHKLEIKGLRGLKSAQVPERDKVAPLPENYVSAMAAKLSGDLNLIWRILSGTGCRLGEVTGLRMEDVMLEHEIPHIRIEWHEARRLKTRSSIRSVPLVGDALVAAQEAVSSSDGSIYLFPRYARDGGPDAASAALMKHLRGFTTNKRHRVHSLRHRLKDQMRKAGVDKTSQDIVLGHAPANIGETYGGVDGLLAVSCRALKQTEEIEE